MGRESRNFYRRLFFVGISFPIAQFIWNRRDWFQSLEYTPEEEAEATAGTVTSSNLKFFSPFFNTNLDQEKVTASSSFSSNVAKKEHYAEKIRSNKISKLEEAEVDVLIIGGGATGLFAALDASTRGLKVALVEQSDFGSGVTGASTSLLHSGFKRAQAALRQRDQKQLVQLIQDASELKALERCVSTIDNNTSNNNNNNKWTADSVVKKMPTIFPISSMSEFSEFCLCSVMFSICTILGGGVTAIARPTFPGRITKGYEGIQESETDELVCGFQVPERKIDGYALSRSLAHTATKHGASIVNYARVIGLDCEENAPRNEKKDTFKGITSWELERRSMDIDGQPFPWFDTGVKTDYFVSEPIAKPKESDDESSDDHVPGARSRFVPERILEKEKEHQQLGISREEDMPYYSVHAAVIRDELTGKIFRVYPKYVMNCTGRWGDSIRRMFPVKQPQMFERWSAQFFLVGHHNDPRSDSLKEKDNNNNNNNSISSMIRSALISARNHVDAKPLFVYPYGMMSSKKNITNSSEGGKSSNENQNTSNNNNNNNSNKQHEWSIIGPVDAPIDVQDPYYAAPEKEYVITGDPKSVSPSAWRELKTPRITPNDLSFIATASDIFGVHIDSGFTLVQPRVLAQSWPGEHPSLCRALRFGGAVDYRGMHQKIVHSVGTETVWSRKKAELMVDSFFIEQSRGADRKVRIPPCRTKKLALEQPVNCVVPLSSSSSENKNNSNENNNNFTSSAAALLPHSRIPESELRSWARFDGCATILDALLRRKQDLFMIPGFVTSSKMRREEIQKIGSILAEEWNWSSARLKSEVECASIFFERNCFAAED